MSDDETLSPRPVTDITPVGAEDRTTHVDRRMAEADTLLDIANAQLAVAARHIANAHAAEREYRRTIWHYSQLMRHRISNPLQTIIGMADTLRAMPDLEPSRRIAMLEAISQQARVLRDMSVTPRALNDSERDLRPAPLDEAVRALRSTRNSESQWTRFHSIHTIDD